MDPNGLCDPFARFFVRKEVDPHVPEKHMAKSTTKYKVFSIVKMITVGYDLALFVLLCGTFRTEIQCGMKKSPSK